MTRLKRFLAILLFLPGAAMAQTGNGGPAGTFFAQSDLNPGLGALPRWIDRSTPQGTIESFLDAAADQDWAAAAHLLNLVSITPGQQSQVGRLRARQLATVLERKAVISWRTLLERPDALDANQSSNAAMAGQPRRSLLIGILDVDDREVAIRLNRIWTGSGEAAWVFSDRTVERAPALFQVYGPTDMERAMPGWLTTETVAGFQLWELIGVPLVLIAAFTTGALTNRLMRRLSGRAKTYWSHQAFQAVRWPSVIVVTTTTVLILALRIFSVSGLLSAVLTPLVLVGYVVAVLMFAMSLLDTALDRMVTFDTEKLADPENSRIRNMATVMTAARRALIVVGLAVGVAIVMISANLNRTLGMSLLASAGALTIVLGFAAREVLGNILASLQISMNRSARIGDRIIFEGSWCTVERIHFTFVQLKIWNGNRLVVPVSYFVTQTFENWSMADGGMVCFAKMTFAQQADIHALRERFLAICAEEDEIDPKNRCKVIVVGQDAFGVEVRLEFPVPDPDMIWDVECQMRERILRAARDLERETGDPVLPQAGIDGLAA